jgi:branched-chain amino acid transport system ATP-binding protein
MADLLSLDTVTAGYGEAVVIDAVSLALAEGEGLALLGRNGVGKSTLIQTVMGLTRHLGGSIGFAGADITRLPAHQRARRGLGWVPQERDIFKSLTVEENLTVAARPGDWTVARIWDLFPRLAERRQNRGNQLSGGEQQMLAIARTLMTNPRLLLLDEPLEGLAPIIAEELTDTISRMKAATGMALILVEQHAEVALGATDRAIIIERGRIAWSGGAAAQAADHDTRDP